MEMQAARFSWRSLREVRAAKVLIFQSLTWVNCWTLHRTTCQRCQRRSKSTLKALFAYQSPVRKKKIPNQRVAFFMNALSKFVSKLLSLPSVSRWLKWSLRRLSLKLRCSLRSKSLHSLKPARNTALTFYWTQENRNWAAGNGPRPNL